MSRLKNLMNSDLLAVLRGRRHEFTLTAKGRYWDSAEAFLAGKLSKSAKSAAELEEVIEAAGYSLDDFERHVALLHERAGLATIADSVPELQATAKAAAKASTRRFAEWHAKRIQEMKEWDAEYQELEAARGRAHRNLEEARKSAGRLAAVDRELAEERGDLTDDVQADEASAPSSLGYEVRTLHPAAGKDQATEVPPVAGSETKPRYDILGRKATKRDDRITENERKAVQAEPEQITQTRKQGS